MKAFFFLLTLALFLVGRGFSSGQQASRPSAPLVDSSVPNIHLVKEYTYGPPVFGPQVPEAEREAAIAFLASRPRLAQNEIIKTGPISDEIDTLTTRQVYEEWRSAPYIFTPSTLYPGHYDAALIAAHDADPNFQSGIRFNELSWIKLDDYQGEQVQQNITCFFYQDGDRSAWIDEKTRLPLLYKSASLQIVYSYRPAPSSSLELPDACKKALALARRAGTTP